MKLNPCLLSYFIIDNQLVNTCDFQPDKLNEGKVIYEVIRVIDATPLFFSDHIKRFIISIEKSSVDISISEESIAFRIKTLIEINKFDEGNIRFQISITYNKPTIFSAWIVPSFYPNQDLRDKGASLKTISAQRKNPNIKIHNPNLKNEVSRIIDQGEFYEVLLVDQKGKITEGSRSNIFFIKENEIFTPSISTVLPGITRLKVIEIANRLGFNCNETSISNETLESYNAAFITGTSPKVLPVRNINKTIYNPDNPIIKAIVAGYEQLIEESIDSFS